MKSLILTFFVLIISVVAVGQERPLSPPERAPVPLTDRDQTRAAADSLAKKEAAPVRAKEVIVPAGAPSRHISTGNAAYDQIVSEAAAQYQIDPCLIICIMRAESSFHLLARSPKGALGVMQLMPATATRFGVRNVFDVRENVFGGTKYLRWLLDRYQGDVRLALAAYNAGEGAVDLYDNRIPPYGETQAYVRLIYSRYSSIHDAHLDGLTGETQKPVDRSPAESNVKPATFNQIIRFAADKPNQ